MTRILVRIDTLRLKGFAPVDRHAIASGLQDELSRALGEAGWASHLAALGSIDRIEAPAVSITPGMTPARVGAKAAQSIGKGLKRRVSP